MVQISKRPFVLLLWIKRHVFPALRGQVSWVPVWKVSGKNPFRCKISPCFAKKSRLNHFLPLEANFYGFDLSVFAHFGQYEAKPTWRLSMSKSVRWVNALTISCRNLDLKSGFELDSGCNLRYLDTTHSLASVFWVALLPLAWYLFYISGIGTGQNL